MIYKMRATQEITGTRLMLYMSQESARELRKKLGEQIGPDPDDETGVMVAVGVENGVDISEE